MTRTCAGFVAALLVALTLAASGTAAGEASTPTCKCAQPGSGTNAGGGGPASDPGTPRSPAAAQAGSDSGGGRLPVLLAGATGTALAATLLGFLVVVPWRKRRPLREALTTVEQDREASFPEAVGLLRTAITAGLRPGALAEARFALAYVLVRLREFDEAASVLTALTAMKKPGREAVYLDLWVKVVRERYEEAVALHEAAERDLGDLRQTRMLASIAYLKAGRTAMRKRDPDRALRCFARVRELGLLADKVPGDIADHQIVLAVEALFDRDVDGAKRRFSAALEAARQEDRSTLYPQLGLLVCEWRETQPRAADFDARLGEVVRETVDVATDVRLMRDVKLWHATSALDNALGLPEGHGPPADGWAELRARLDSVRALDPEIPDPDLLDGLVAYWFAADERARAAGVKLLDEALYNGANVPEVNLIVQREFDLAEAAEQSVEHFITVARHYLGERSVPVEVRRQLQERLSRNERFQVLAEVDVERGATPGAPSVDDLHGRGELMRRRVEQLVTPQLTRVGSDEAEHVGRVLRELEGATASLSETARKLTDYENQLMLVTGQFLLHEEEPVHPARSATEEL